MTASVSTGLIEERRGEKLILQDCAEFGLEMRCNSGYSVERRHNRLRNKNWTGKTNLKTIEATWPRSIQRTEAVAVGCIKLVFRLKGYCRVAGSQNAPPLRPDRVSDPPEPLRCPMGVFLGCKM